MCLLEHLLLHLSNFLPFYLLLFPDLGLVLCNLISAALTTPPLSLLRTELVSPLMAALASDSDDCYVFNGNDGYFSVHLAGLALDRIDNLDAVVTKALLAVHEVPELNFASITCLLRLFSLCDRASSGLELATLLNCAGDAVVAHVCTCIGVSLAHWLRIFIFSSCSLCAFGLFDVGRHSCEIGSVNLWGYGDLNSDFSEYVVNLIPLRLLSMAMMPRMRMRLRRLMRRSRDSGTIIALLATFNDVRKGSLSYLPAETLLYNVSALSIGAILSVVGFRASMGLLLCLVGLAQRYLSLACLSGCLENGFINGVGLLNVLHFGFVVLSGVRKSFFEVFLFFIIIMS